MDVFSQGKARVATLFYEAAMAAERQRRSHYPSQLKLGFDRRHDEKI
jgi:hypothetical protein